MEKIDIRVMCHDDIPLICKADNDESESNIAYLKRQLDIRVSRLLLTWLYLKSTEEEELQQL